MQAIPASSERAKARVKRIPQPAKKTVGSKGYRLHAKRIDYSGGTGSMRTIKFPLIGAATALGAKVEQAVFDAIMSDHQALWGISNFADYICYQERRAQNPALPAQPPSFLGLWLEAIRRGVVFAEQAKMQEKFSRLVGLVSDGDRLFKQLAPEFQASLDKAKWVAFMTTPQRSLEKKGADSLKKNVLDCGVSKEAKERLLPVAEAWADGAANAFKDGRLSAFKGDLFGLQVAGTVDDQAAPASDEPTSGWQLGFALDPRFPAETLASIADRTLLVDAILRHHQAGGLFAASELVGIGNNGNYFNGFFGDFFTTLLDDAVREKAVADMAAVFGFDGDRLATVRDRMAELADYAKQLPANPRLDSRWAEYRSDFNGTLESWHSNLASKRQTALAGVQDVRAAAVELTALLQKKGLQEEEAFASIDGLLKVIPEDVAVVDRTLTNQLVAAQADVRLTLNELAQRVDGLFPNTKTKDGGTDKAANKAPLRQRIDQKVQASPLFYGESQQQYFEKAYQARRQVAEQVAVVKSALAVGTGDADLESKVVQQLAVSASRAEAQAVRAVYLQVQQALGVDFSAIADRTRAFWTSPFARRKPELLPIPHTLTVGRLVQLSRLAELLDAATQTLDATLLRDAVALSKIVTFAHLAATGQTSRETRLAIVTAHSELSGLVALTSKRAFVSRYALQSVNGLQVQLGRSRSATGQVRHCYGFPDLAGFPVLDKAEWPELVPPDGWLLDGNKQEPDRRPSLNAKGEPLAAQAWKFKGVSLQVASSYHQVQFLDWLYAPGTRAADLERKGAFTIAEQDATLDWSTPLPTVRVLANTPPPAKRRKMTDLKGRHRRIYTSQPFELVPRVKDRSAKGTHPRHIGVDIGEYGLAFCAIEVRPAAQPGEKPQAVVLEKGFIAHPAQMKLADDVKALRERQIKATFQAVDTHLARLRESLVGYYKAELEDLSIRHGGALAFEMEVSAFESGGKKVAKIYDSVKRGDVWGQSDAEKADMKQAWGVPGQKGGQAKPGFRLPWAEQITAAGTSQTCTKCGRWYRLDLEASNHQGGEQVRAYADASGLQLQAIIQSRTPDEVKQFKKAVYAAMRPNAEGAGMDLVRQTHPTFALGAFVAKRGNSAVYVCPYAECGHIADADLQAAFNIAVRGYLKTRDKQAGGRGVNGQAAASVAGSWPSEWYYDGAGRHGGDALIYEPQGLV